MDSNYSDYPQEDEDSDFLLDNYGVDCGDTLQEESKEDKVNDPSHYTKGVEVLQFIRSWSLNFSCGNAIKYIVRSPYKGKAVEDLSKALFYVAFELEQNGGQKELVKFCERYLSKKRMLTKEYELKE